MQHMLQMGLLPHLSLPFLTTSWPVPPLPAFLDLDQQSYQSPDLERPPSPQSFHPTTGYPWPVVAFAHSTGLPPLLPSPHMMAISTPPTPEPSSPSSSPGKRKRGAKPKKEVRSQTAPSSSTALQQGQSTAQVVKWKLNTPRYKRLKVQTEDGGSEWKRCEHCGTDSTPEWRTGPLGKGTLCNACGLRYRSKLREQKKRDTTKTPSGTVPMSLLLNPASNGNKCKKGRTCVNNPMIWETKVSASSSPGCQIADLLN